MTRSTGQITRATAHDDLVMERFRAAHARLVDLFGRLVISEGLASGMRSPLAHVSAALRGEDPWLPQHLVGRREELRTAMLNAIPTSPDVYTAQRLELLVGLVSTGLALAGPAAPQAGFAVAIAELIAAQILPFTPQHPEPTP